MVALDLKNAVISRAFAACDGVHLIPGLKKFAVLRRKIDAIGLFHVKMNAGDEPPDFFTRLNLFFFEVDDGFALAVHGFWVVCPLVEHKVAAVAVYFADGGVEVVHIAFHDLECGVVRAAILAAAVTPAGEVLPHVVGGHDMFPFDALGALETFAVRIFTRSVIA